MSHLGCEQLNLEACLELFVLFAVVVELVVVAAAVLAVKEKKIVFRRLRVLLSLRVNISEHVPNLN